VDEIAARDGAELARREESSDWDLAESAAHSGDIVVRLTE